MPTTEGCGQGKLLAWGQPGSRTRYRPQSQDLPKHARKCAFLGISQASQLTVQINHYTHLEGKTEVLSFQHKILSLGEIRDTVKLR